MSLDVGEPGVERGDTGVTEGNKKKKTASPYHLAAMAPAAESLPDG